MSDTATVLTSLQSELQTVVSNNTSVSTPANHVGKHEPSDDPPHPYIGFRGFTRPINVGMGPSVRVHEVNDTNNDGLIDEIIFARDYELTWNVYIEADGDNAQARDELQTALEDHFAPFVDGTFDRGDPTSIDSDIESIVENGSSPANRPRDDVRGVRKQYTVEYTRFNGYTDFEPMETIDLTVTETGQNPETYFDETIS